MGEVELVSKNVFKHIKTVTYHAASSAALCRAIKLRPLGQQVNLQSHTHSFTTESNIRIAELIIRFDKIIPKHRHLFDF